MTKRQGNIGSIQAVYGDKNEFLGLSNPSTAGDGVDIEVATYATAPDGSITGLDAGDHLKGLSEFVPLTNDYVGILAAYNAAVAAGGGVVKLLPITYNILGNTLPIESNIKYIGSGFDLLYASIPDDAGATLSGGTIVQGDGTANIFAYNSTYRDADYATPSVFANTGLTNIGISNMGIRNGLSGIIIGGYKNSGCWYSNFTDLWVEDCSVVGAWFENVLHCTFKSINTARCGSGNKVYDVDGIDMTGGQVYATSGATKLTPTNSYFQSLYNITSNASAKISAKTRGIRFIARGNTGCNSITTDFIQSNRFNTATTPVAVTMTSGSNLLAVADSSNFSLEMPITFSGSANYTYLGSTTNSIVGAVYFVVSIPDATHIAVSKYIGGAPMLWNASGAGLGNINGMSFPCFEFVGYDLISQTASYSAGNITVSNGRVFFYGQPVKFDTSTVAPITTNTTYYVNTIVGNVITVGTAFSGGVVSGEISTAGSGTLGNAHSTSSILTEAINGIDAEGVCTTKILVQACSGGFSGDQLTEPTTVSPISVCTRNSYDKNSSITFRNSNTQLVIDCDSNAAFTLSGVSTSAYVQSAPVGLYNAGSLRALNFGVTGTKTPDYIGKDSGWGTVIDKGSNLTVKQKPYVFANTAASPLSLGAFAQAMTFNGVANGGIQLRQITDNSLGIVFEICNPTAFTVAITSFNASQLFNNKAASTVLTMSANSSVKLRMDVLNGVFFIAVLATVGTVTF